MKEERKGKVVYGLGWCHLCGRRDIVCIETSLLNRHGDEVPVCEDCIKAVHTLCDRNPA